jgi:hypothetical protein
MHIDKIFMGILAGSAAVGVANGISEANAEAGILPTRQVATNVAYDLAQCVRSGQKEAAGNLVRHVMGGITPAHYRRLWERASMTGDPKSLWNGFITLFEGIETGDSRGDSGLITLLNLIAETKLSVQLLKF